MDGCLFRFYFKSGFTLPDKFWHIAMKSNISSAADCLAVNTLRFDLFYALSLSLFNLEKETIR